MCSHTPSPSTRNTRTSSPPLVLPAEPDKPLTTQGGNTLDDGTGDQTLASGAYIHILDGPNNAPTTDSAISSGAAGANNGLQIRTTELIQLVSGAGVEVAGLQNLGATGGITLDTSAHLSSGTGAPTIAGTAGDFFFRTDTPTTADQRIYVCTVSGAAGAATWVGIV